MWCASAPQRRTVVLDVARPPERRVSGLPRRLRRRVMVVGDPDRPALGGRRARDGDVAAEVDEHGRAPGRRGGRRGRAIGGQRLRGGAEVQAHASRDPHHAARRIDRHRPPARHPGGDEPGRPVADGREVPVVAGEDERLADRGIDDPAGQRGGAQRDRDRLEQPRPGADRTAGTGVEAGELGIGAEAAAGEVDGGKLRLDRAAGRRQRVRVGDDEARLGAERGPARDAAHDPPDVSAWGRRLGRGCGRLGGRLQRERVARDRGTRWAGGTRTRAARAAGATALDWVVPSWPLKAWAAATESPAASTPAPAATAHAAPRRRRRSRSRRDGLGEEAADIDSHVPPRMVKARQRAPPFAEPLPKRP